MIYLTSDMNILFRRIIMLGIGLLVALFSAALTHSVAVQSTDLVNNASAGIIIQTTVTPQQEDRSEVGSTDEIVAMGGFIVLIIILPIILQRKNWMRLMQQ